MMHGTTTLEEGTPLVQPRTGPRANRRRQNPSDNHNNLFVPELGHGDYDRDDDDDDDKDRPRSFWQRVREGMRSVIPVVRGNIRARTDDCDGNPWDREQFMAAAKDGCRPTGAQQGEQIWYEDDYNDESWTCSFGTAEDDGIWLNVHDRVGTLMSSLVWILVVYSGVTVGLLSQYNHLPPFLAKCYYTICALALASHAKTTFTDPGAIPQAAVPVDVYTPAAHAMCSRCQSFKPPKAHHCRICDRCISGMDRKYGVNDCADYCVVAKGWKTWSKKEISGFVP